MHPVKFLCCLAGLLFVAGVPAARAQVVSLPGIAAHPAEAAPPALTPAEAREMVDLLNDPQKRARLHRHVADIGKGDDGG